MSDAEPSTPAAATHSLTLARGLRVLWVLREHGEGMSVAEVAEALGTHRAGVYRLLAPLTDHRLVRRTPDGRYVLGSGLIELAAGVQLHLRAEAERVLRELADQLDATAALTIREGDEAVVAIVIPPRTQLVHLTYRTGMRHPLSKGAPGLALLAAMPPRPGEAAEVIRARRRGWAMSTGELLPGATGVAAAICPADGDPVAALSAVWIAGIDTERAGEAVAQAAERVTRQIRT